MISKGNNHDLDIIYFILKGIIYGISYYIRTNKMQDTNRSISLQLVLYLLLFSKNKSSSDCHYYAKI